MLRALIRKLRKFMGNNRNATENPAKTRFFLERESFFTEEGAEGGGTPDTVSLLGSGRWVILSTSG